MSPFTSQRSPGGTDQMEAVSWPTWGWAWGPDHPAKTGLNWNNTAVLPAVFLLLCFLFLLLLTTESTGRWPQREVFHLMTEFNTSDAAVNAFQDAYLLDYFMNLFSAWDDYLVMKELNFRESHSHMDKGTDLFFPSMPTIRAVFSFHGDFWPPLLVWHRLQSKPKSPFLLSAFLPKPKPTPGMLSFHILIHHLLLPLLHNHPEPCVLLPPQAKMSSPPALDGLCVWMGRLQAAFHQPMLCLGPPKLGPLPVTRT